MSYNIQVCCRLRPKDRKNESIRIDNVVEDSTEEFIKVIAPDVNPQISQTKEISDKPSPIISINNKTNFSIDQVFEDSSQNEIFEQSLEPMLQDLFKGIHCTLFTYGQTGSGKTHTVIGGDKEERGLLPRAVEYIFDKISASSPSEPQKLLTQQTIVKLSFIEIYHEKLHDLLSVHYQPHKQPPPTSSCLSEENHVLAIRQASDGTIFVENLQEVTIQSFEEFQKYLNVALKKRMVGSHRMNEYSSRSHLCCLIDLIQYQYPSSQPSAPTTKSLRKLHSKLSIIDLAGSEMARKTEASGQRFQEAKFINKSLSALSKVIGTLALRYEQQSATSASSTLGAESTHVPYRDSKLTRLLQNSLGGNSKTIIILTVSRNKDHISETISTLKFGERARLIKITPQVNSLASTTGLANQLSANSVDTTQTKELEDTISQLKDQILSLNQIISDLRNDQVSSSHTASSSTISDNTVEFSHEFSTNYSTSLCQMCKRVVGSEERRRFGSYQKDGDDEDREVENPQALNESEEDEEAEDEEIEEEVVERCAICGLNVDETENLKHLTNEDLGFLFSCDGNCGNKFHIRCVGVVGEGGQFTLPEGEWFCNDCTVQLSEVAIQKEKDEQLKTLSPIKSSHTNLPSHQSPLSNDNEVESKPEISEGNICNAPQHPVQLHPPTNTHYKEVLIYMNLITSLQQKFNLMRKERNRILIHFQNEKKMFQQLENLRNQKIEVLVSKNLSLQEEKESFEDTIKQLKKQNKFLQHQLQQYEKQQLQQRLQSHNNSTFSPTSRGKAEGNVTSSSAHHSTDWISFTDSQELQHVLHGLYLSSSTNQIEGGGKDSSNDPIQQGSISPRPSSSTSSSSLQANELNRISNTSEGLEYTQSNDENQGHDNIRRSSFIQHRKQISQNIVDQPALLTSLSSRTSEENDHEDSKKLIPKPWVKPPSSNTTTTMKIPTKITTISHNELTNTSITAVGEPSRFVNPLKNRLSELLDLVEEEKHSFQEIRNQFQQHQQQHKKNQIGQNRTIETSEP